MKNVTPLFPSDTISPTKKLVESALMIAMASVLSVIKLAQLPNGGSVTAVSMLPILLIAYRFGFSWGFGCGFTYAVIQQLLGLKNLSYVVGWYSVVAVILLDYLLAYTVLGIAAAFRGKRSSQGKELLCGALLACLCRYLCSVISGAVVWNEFCRLSIPSGAVWLYSAVYNASYMIPETVATALAAWYLSELLDFRSREPVRIGAKRKEEKNSPALSAVLRSLLPLPVIGAVIYDTFAFFSTLPIGDDNRFDFSALTFSAVLPMLIVSVSCVIASLLLFLFSRLAEKKAGM